MSELDTLRAEVADLRNEVEEMRTIIVALLQVAGPHAPPMIAGAVSAAVKALEPR